MEKGTVARSFHHEASAPVLIRAFDNLTAVLKKTEEHARPARSTSASSSRRGWRPTCIHCSRSSAPPTPPRMYAPGWRHRQSERADRDDFRSIFLAGIAEDGRLSQICHASTARGCGRTHDHTLTWDPARTIVTGASYLLGFALPNFFFHITTAYDILRHNGVLHRQAGLPRRQF